MKRVGQGLVGSAVAFGLLETTLGLMPNIVVFSAVLIPTGFAVITLSKSMPTCPESMSLIESCVPLYGTCVSCVPVIEANISAVRCATPFCMTKAR